MNPQRDGRYRYIKYWYLLVAKPDVKVHVLIRETRKNQVSSVSLTFRSRVCQDH